MPYQITSRRNQRKARKEVDIHQNKWPKAYLSTIDDSRRPQDSVSDATNMELVQDNVWRPRPPLARYGTQPANTVIGRGKFRQDGERYLLWMQNDSGTGKLYKQKDGGAFTVYADADNSYDDVAWASCVQTAGKVYIYNGVDNLSYINLDTDAIVKYTALSTPGAPTVTMAGATSTGFNYYYRITANNEVGESIAGASGTDTTNKPRDNWIENTDYMTLTWSSVAGATSYTVYLSDNNIDFFELYTTAGLTFTDYGTQAINVFRRAPEGNSTAGPVFTYMYSDTKSSQLYGITADNKLYYSSSTETTASADFSPYNGGGYVTIDEDGDTELNFVDGFRNGKGDPVITVSARGAAGKGKLYHVSFESVTAGDQTIFYPNVYEANGQSGTYAPRATIKARDSLYYPTGQDFKSTGTSQNIVNILTTNTISQGIEPDTDNLSLANLHKAVGLEYKDKLYFALPVGSTENNEIWYMDLARKNAWVLRWPIAVKDMWLYEDNDGSTHFCVLVDNVILEFTRAGAVPHQDDGTAWESRLAFESLVWDEDGITMGKIRRQYFKFLYPRGTIQVNTRGLSRSGLQSATGSDSYTVTTTPTGYDVWTYDLFQYDADPGVVDSYGKGVAVLEVRPKGLVNQLDWEILSETLGTDYILSAVRTKGHALDHLVLKT